MESLGAFGDIGISMSLTMFFLIQENYAGHQVFCLVMVKEYGRWVELLIEVVPESNKHENAVTRK